MRAAWPAERVSNVVQPTTRALSLHHASRDINFRDQIVVCPVAQPEPLGFVALEGTIRIF